jgi:hypothetical protein
MWFEPEPPPDPGMIPAAGVGQSVTSNQGVIDFGPDSINLQQDGWYYIQAGFTVFDNLSTPKYYCFVQDNQNSIIAGTGGFVEGYSHYQTFSMSFLYNASGNPMLYFKMIDLGAFMSGTWTGLVVNVIKVQ